MKLKNLVVIDFETSGTEVHAVPLSVAMSPLYAQDSDSVNFFIDQGINDDEIWSGRGKEFFQDYKADWERLCLRPQTVRRKLKAELKAWGFTKNNPAILIGHNIAFDLRFLRLICNQAKNWNLPISYRSVDTHSLLYILHWLGAVPVEALSSSGAFKYFNIKVPEKLRHTSKGDVAATKQLVFNILAEFNKFKKGAK